MDLFALRRARTLAAALVVAVALPCACKNPAREKPDGTDSSPTSPGGPMPADPAPTAARAEPQEPLAPSAETSDEEQERPATGADVPRSGPRASSTKAKGRKRARDGSHHAPEPAAATSGDFGLSRLVVAKGVSGREPVGAAHSFKKSDTDRVYAFVEIANPTREAGEVVVSFVPAGGGGGGQSVKLEVGSEARWRTWAVTRRLGPGSWNAIVRSSDGRELGRTSFEITP